MASSSSSAPPPPPPLPPPPTFRMPAWIILGRVARVPPPPEDANAQTRPVTVVPPPRISTVSVPTNVHPNRAPGGADKHPYVIAACESGLLLHMSASPHIGFNLGGRPPGMLAFLFAGARPGEPVFYSVCGRGYGQLRLYSLKSVGLLPMPGGQFVVAELVLNGCASLLTNHSSSDEWTETADLVCPLISENGTGRWVPHDVVPHAGHLWWMDLAKGLIFCNPIDYRPALRFVELPEMFEVTQRAEPLENIDCYRIVREVGGRLRFVDVACRSSIDTLGDTLVAVWTLTVDTSTGAASWEVGDRITTTLARIWEDDSYRRTGMPEAVPEIALMHPARPDVVYFFLFTYFFSVDVRRSVVLEFSPDSYGDLVQPVYANPRPPVNWRYVLPWVLRPSLLNAQGDGHNSSGGHQSSVPSSAPEPHDDGVTSTTLREDVNHQCHLLLPQKAEGDGDDSSGGHQSSVPPSSAPT
ncbi:hypothetical protein ACP70R_032040 [Stipagrostis hirtigluma subsp. patula]